MKPYQALIWNEWRRMRGIVLATAGAMVLLWLTLFVLSMLRIRNIDMIALLILFMLPMLLTCIGFGAFQGELKNQTDNFLLSLPIKRSKIFWGKYLFNLCSYVALVILCCLLFFPLAFDKTSFANFSIMIPTIRNAIVPYLCIHALVVSATLLQNIPNSKVASWTLATAFLALFIGIQAIVSLSPSNETRWLGVTIIIINIIAAFFALGMGCYLWINYLAFKRNIMRPLLISAGAIVTFSVISFTTAYIYSGLDLAAAKREALTAGLILESKPVAPPTLEAKNDAARILEDLQQYQIRLNVVKPKLPSRSGLNDDKYSWLSDASDAQLPLETMRQAANFILDDPVPMKLYANLFNILNKPSCQLNNTALKQKLSGMRLTGIDAIRNFLNDRAYALELEGKTAEAFESLELLDKLAESIACQRNALYQNLNWLDQSQLNTMINLGPDTIAGVKYYEKLLSELASMRPEFYDDTAALMQKFPGNNARNPEAFSGPLKYLYNIQMFILAARYRESIVSFLRWQVAHKQLFEHAKEAKFKEVKSAALNLDKQCSQLSFLINWVTLSQIKRCYIQQTQIAAMQLYLALKIYKAKYGKFPDTLAKLSPEILPVIPRNPISGENFEYHASSNGFSMNTESFELRTKMSKIKPTTYFHTFSYHTWNKNPDQAVQTESQEWSSGNTGNHKTIQNKNEERAK